MVYLESSRSSQLKQAASLSTRGSRRRAPFDWPVPLACLLKCHLTEDPNTPCRHQDSKMLRGCQFSRPRLRVEVN